MEEKYIEIYLYQEKEAPVQEGRRNKQTKPKTNKHHIELIRRDKATVTTD